MVGYGPHKPEIGFKSLIATKLLNEAQIYMSISA